LKLSLFNNTLLKFSYINTNKKEQTNLDSIIININLKTFYEIILNNIIFIPMSQFEKNVEMLISVFKYQENENYYNLP